MFRQPQHLPGFIHLPSGPSPHEPFLPRSDVADSAVAEEPDEAPRIPEVGEVLRFELWPARRRALIDLAGIERCGAHAKRPTASASSSASSTRPSSSTTDARSSNG